MTQKLITAKVDREMKLTREQILEKIREKLDLILAQEAAR